MNDAELQRMREELKQAITNYLHMLVRNGHPTRKVLRFGHYDFAKGGGAELFEAFAGPGAKMSAENLVTELVQECVGELEWRL